MKTSGFVHTQKEVCGSLWGQPVVGPYDIKLNEDCERWISISVWGVQFSSQGL